MPNLMQRSATWIGQQLRVVAGRTVTYYRGTGSVQITAVGVMQRHTLVGQDNITSNVRMYEWTINAASLTIGGEQLTPRAGDAIRETIAGKVVTYQVLDLDEETPCYEWLDSSGIELKIHSKRVR